MAQVLLEVRCDNGHGKCGRLLATVDSDLTFQALVRMVPYNEAAPQAMKFPDFGFDFSFVALECPKHGFLGPVTIFDLEGKADYVAHHPRYRRHLELLTRLKIYDSDDLPPV